MYLLIHNLSRAIISALFAQSARIISETKYGVHIEKVREPPPIYVVNGVHIEKVREPPPIYVVRCLLLAQYTNNSHWHRGYSHSVYPTIPQRAAL